MKINSCYSNPTSECEHKITVRFNNKILIRCYLKKKSKNKTATKKKKLGERKIKENLPSFEII